MIWNPYRKIQQLEADLRKRDQDFTEAVVEVLEKNANAVEEIKNIAETDAVEIASGMYQRAFQSARIEPMNELTRLLSPQILGIAGREMVACGESVFPFAFTDDGLVLYIGAAWDIKGNYDRSTWRYRVDLMGPSGNGQKRFDGDSVFHFQYAVHPQTPWKGLSVKSLAVGAGKLKLKIDQKILQEFSAPIGHLIAVPQVVKIGDDDPLAELKRDLQGLKGNTALVETVMGGWGDGRYSEPKRDWTPTRIGPNPPPPIELIRQSITYLYLNAFGIPSSLVGEGSDGTALREGWRQFLHGTIQPIANGMADEISRKADTEVKINFDQLFASDIQGRGRAFNSLTSGGMSVEQAARVTGTE